MAYTTDSSNKSPGTITSEDFGGNPWTNPSNAASSNDTYATVSLDAAEESDYLVCSNFGFTLPDHALVTGLLVNVEAKVGAAGVGDWTLRVVLHGQSDEILKTIALTASDAVFTAGGDRKIMPATLDFNLTSLFQMGHPIFGADLNNSKYTIKIAILTNPGTTATLSVDHINMTAYYTTGFRINTTGAKTVGTIASKYNDALETPAAGSAWSNTGNIAASDDTYATNTVLATTGNTALLRLTNFAFNIPTNAIVIGSKIEVDHKSDAAGDVFAHMPAFCAPGSNSYADSVDGEMYEYPANETEEVGSTETTTTYIQHGQPIMGSGMVNNSDFGVLLYYSNSGGSNSVVSVDNVRVTLYYIVLPLTISNTGALAPSAVGEVSILGNAWTNEANTLSSNNSYGTVLMDRDTKDRSNLLEFSGFDTSTVPDDAIIVGFGIGVEQKIDVANADIAPQAYVTLSDATTGNDFAGYIGSMFAGWGATPGTSDAVATIGGSMIFMGVGQGSDALWTGKRLKDGNLSVQLNYLLGNGNSTDRTVSVDAVTLTVYYATALKVQRKSPGTFATEAGDAGTDDWTNISNAASSNDTYATCAIDASSEVTYTIKATNFSFNIPTDARIIGYQITAELKDSLGTEFYGVNMALLRDATHLSVPAELFVSMETSDNKFYRGQFLTESFGIEPSEVNSSAFGVVMWINGYGSSVVTISLDHIELEILYVQPNQPAIMAAMI